MVVAGIELVAFSFYKYHQLYYFKLRYYCIVFIVAKMEINKHQIRENLALLIQNVFFLNLIKE